MADTKRRFEYFAFYDVQGMAEHFEKMAAKGWMIDSVASVFHRYRKIQPRKMKFAVVYMNKLSDFARPSDRHREFYAACASAGWQPVIRQDSMQIFANTAEDPAPIETDPVVQVENIHISVGKKFFLLSMAAALIWLFNIRGYRKSFYAWPETFFTVGRYNSMKNRLMLAVILAAPAVDYILWYLKAVKTAREENRFYYKKTGVVLPAVIYTSLAVVMYNNAQRNNLLFFAVALFGVAVISGVYVFMKKVLGSEKGSGGENEAFAAVLAAAVLVLWITGAVYGLEQLGISTDAKTSTAIRTETWYSHPAYSYKKYVYADDIPLKLEDFTAVDYGGYSYEGDTYADNPVIGFYTASQQADSRSGMPELFYDIYTTDSAHLYDSIVQRHLKMRNSAPVENSLWQAEKVYKATEGTAWLLCYPGKIIYMNTGADIDEKDIPGIEEKLCGFEI